MNANTKESVLRVIRFFLPRLNEMDLTLEIDRRLAQIREEMQRGLGRIREDAEQKRAREIDELQKRIAEIETSRGSLGIGLVFLLFLGALGFAAPDPVRAWLVGLALFLACIGWFKMNQKADEIARLRDSLEKAKKDSAKQSEKDLAEAERRFGGQIEELKQLRQALLRLYSQSEATEKEVNDFIDSRLDLLRKQVFGALGFDSKDVQDRRSAEAWAPTFFQTEKLPHTVEKDQDSSERNLWEQANAIIAPLEVGLPRELWQEFKVRVLQLWGLSGPSKEPKFSSLRAIRFSVEQKRFLARHYFFQKIVCVDYCLGLFRAYVNILNDRIPCTQSIQILYSDVAAIGVQTAFQLENYQISGMTVTQHTQTLTLELNSGTSYNMSNDAGSFSERLAPPTPASVDPAERYQPIPNPPQNKTETFRSSANEAFRQQIESVRSFVRDSKSKIPTPSQGEFRP